MSTLNQYFTTSITQGTEREQNLVEDLIIESIQIYGIEVLYIPRTFISKDEILGEDRLSSFDNAFPIPVYLNNPTGFDGGGFMASKFGLMVEQSASVTVTRKHWDDLIRTTESTILPNRPCEGDLLYFPLSKGLFEIKFTQHQNPFYQLGRLYVYTLDIELFQYASEKLNTGVEDIDNFETLKSFDTTINSDIDVPDSYGDNNTLKTVGSDFIFNSNNPFGDAV